MNNRSKRTGKLGLRKQTLRRLTSLPEDQLRRVAGGTWAGGTWIDSGVEPESGECTLVDKNGRSATGSANCRGGDWGWGG